KYGSGREQFGGQAREQGEQTGKNGEQGELNLYHLENQTREQEELNLAARTWEAEMDQLRRKYQEVCNAPSSPTLLSRFPASSFEKTEAVLSWAVDCTNDEDVPIKVRPRALACS
ncbi:hypothetical protein Dimus_006179, partial [Dionaea muscipula]